jgi:hypothetical protein
MEKTVPVETIPQMREGRDGGGGEFKYDIL